MADPNGNGIESLPPPSGELMKSALADFTSKSLPDRLRILQNIGILDQNGDLSPEYSEGEDDDEESEQEPDR